MATAAVVTLQDMLNARNELVRQGEFNERTGAGGYRLIGKMIEMRHEVAKDSNAPDREETKKIGVTMDWRNYHNGPALGLTRDRTQLLIIGKVNPLPDIIDPSWIPTQFVNMPYGRIAAAALSPEERKASGIVLEEPPKAKQRFVDHMSGRLENFMVCRPLTQILFKIEGVQGMTTIDFTADPYPGTFKHSAFLLDPANGEGHIIGGQFSIATLRGA